MTEQWYLVRPDGTDDPDLQSVSVRHGLAPFSNVAEVTLQDPDGEKRAAYPEFTHLELDVEVPGVISRRRRFAGFVGDYADDRDELTLTLLAPIFWARKTSDVFLSVTDEPVSSVLEQVVAETPLVWDSSLVEVENDVAITREWVGEPAEAILGELREVSGGGEIYGATFDREFTWSALEDERAPRQFTQDEYLDVTVEEDHKREANRAVVTYGEGDSQATVARNDRSAQRELADRVGSTDPVQVPVRENRPDITTEDRAIDYAEHLLEEHSAVESATIETWEAFDVDPGQLTDLVAPEVGLEEEVRIVQLDHEWPAGDPPTSVTAAGQALDTVDELVELNDTVQRLDLQNVNPDAPFLETVQERTGVVLRCSASLGWRQHADSTFTPGENRAQPGENRDVPGVVLAARNVVGSTVCRSTNTLLNELRDVWRGDQMSVTIDRLALGTDPTRPSRTDMSLGNETNREPIDATFAPGNTVARWEATIPEPDVTIESANSSLTSVDVSGQDEVWVEIEGAEGAAGQDGAVGAGGAGGLGAVTQGLLDVSTIDTLSVYAADGPGGFNGADAGEDGEGDAGDGGNGAGSSAVGWDGVARLEAGGGGGGGGGAGTDGALGGDGGDGGGEADNGGPGGEGGTATTADGEVGGVGRSYQDEDYVSLFDGEAGHPDGAGDGVVRIYERPPPWEIGLLENATDSLKKRAVFDHDVESQGILDESLDAVCELRLDRDDRLRGVPTNSALGLSRDALLGEDISASIASQLAFGSGTTEPSVHDSSLEDAVATKAIAEQRTRGTGRTDATARILESEAPGETISELGQVNDADELLTRLTFAGVELTGLDLEATEILRFANP